MDSPYQSVSSIVDEKAVSIQHLELPHDQDSPKAATLETQQNNNIDDELEIRKQFKDLLAVPRFMEMRRIHRRLLCLVDCIMIMILACYLDEPEEQWYNDTFLVIGALLVYVATTWESFALIKPNYWKGAANIGLMDDRSTLKENFRKDFYFGKINMVWDPEERRLGVVEMRIPFLIRYIADPDAYLGNPFHMFSPYYAVEIGATIHLAKIALMFFCYQLQTSYGPVAWNFLSAEEHLAKWMEFLMVDEKDPEHVQRRSKVGLKLILEDLKAPTAEEVSCEDED
ncbi:hypothetical protein GLAREA_06599 [Glarea lozoyensis ATCC 20868]|uniref:Uncharacterized protein n=1 Tax=Glarea lozoyensis (strain ATCC 20868 / MF5171) TaxID=1116229 RepID=S3DNB4_GLAL2|nr:uncharacterized protein GLAREA_06599 [Glarea lozoyensis ATCC 20868]EPE33586.1 hypothetical protein GLAREA_06599 [Glarea lozoyensis ATCC 20868]